DTPRPERETDSAFQIVIPAHCLFIRTGIDDSFVVDAIFPDRISLGSSHDFAPRMRRTAVRPICRRRAISDLLMPPDIAFGFRRHAAPPFPAGPGVCRSAGPAPSQPECARAEFHARTPRKWRADRPSRDRLAWSDPAPPSARRSRRRGVQVPGASPANPLQNGPTGPAARPAPGRPPADGRLPAAFRALLALPPRN